MQSYIRDTGSGATSRRIWGWGAAIVLVVAALALAFATPLIARGAQADSASEADVPSAAELMSADEAPDAVEQDGQAAGEESGQPSVEPEATDPVGGEADQPAGEQGGQPSAEPEATDPSAGDQEQPAPQDGADQAGSSSDEAGDAPAQGDSAASDAIDQAGSASADGIARADQSADVQQAPAAPLAAIPAATGVHLTEFAIYTDNTLTTRVADLLAGDVPELHFGTEYYLSVKVLKDNPGDSTWVSVSVPWWASVNNRPAGDSWNRPGTDFSHTSLDKVLSWTTADGKSKNASTNAGSVVYHITESSDVSEAGFQMSITPAIYYANGADVQSFRSAHSQFSAATGDMDGGQQGAVRSTCTSPSVDVTGKGSFYSYGPEFISPYVGLDGEPTTASATVWASGSWGSNAVFSKVEFDVVAPKGMELSNVVTWGVTATQIGEGVDNGDGTVTYHFVSTPNGDATTGRRTITADAVFPSQYFPTDPKNYTAQVTNISVSVYGDEDNVPIPGSTTLTWKMIMGAPKVLVYAKGAARYDWLNKEGVAQSTMLSMGDIWATGTSDGEIATESYTVKVDVDPTLIVRAITVPLYDDHGSTILVNGQTYDLASVASELHEVAPGDMTGYAVVQLPGGAAISSFSYEVGKLRGDYHSYARPDIDAPDNKASSRFALWGSYGPNFTGSASSHVELFPTGGVLDTSDKDKQANLIASTTNNKYISVSGTANPSSSQLLAGDPFTCTGRLQVDEYVGSYGSTTSWVNDYALYMVMPKGFDLTGFTIAGEPVKPEDITDTDYVQNKPTDGTRIYRITPPREMPIGSYNVDMTRTTLDYSYTVSTSADMQPTTLNLANVFFIGQGKDQETAYYSYGRNASDFKNPYGINGSGSLRGIGRTVYIQERKALEVSNSMMVNSEGSPLGQWLTYDASNPSETRALVSQSFDATYRVSVSNRTGSTPKVVNVFVPIPKTGANRGVAFYPEGASGLSLSIGVDSLPDGWTFQYVKLADGKTYGTNKVPSASDYQVVDQAEADMLILSYDGTMDRGYEADIDLKLAADPNAVMDPSSVSTWSPMATYVLGSTTFISTSLVPESLETPNGMIEGYVYNDMNYNGQQDDGESGIANVTVEAVEYWAQGFERSQRTLTTQTDQNGHYSFGYTRASAGDATGAGNNPGDGVPTTDPDHYEQIGQTPGSPFDPDEYFDTRKSSINVTVYNPNTATYVFSPVTTTGNHPSVTVPLVDQTSATKAGINYSDPVAGEERVSEVDSGLMSADVIYQPGEHGAFADDAHRLIALGSATPEYAGAVDDQASNPDNVGSPAGELGWRFTGWQPQVADAVAGGITYYVAQWEKVPASVTYQPGEHGTFADDVHAGLLVGSATPEYAGAVDDDESNVDNAGSPAGEVGWRFTGWEPQVAETVASGDAVYVAQWEKVPATVTYQPGEHGTFADDVYTDLMVGSATPDFAGALDDKTTNPDNVGAPAGETGWRFVGWEPQVAETVASGDTVYVAQWEKVPATPDTPSASIDKPATPSASIDQQEKPKAPSATDPSKPSKSNDIPKTADATTVAAPIALGFAGLVVAGLGAGLARRKDSEA